jgi:hypothetical protein
MVDNKEVLQKMIGDYEDMVKTISVKLSELKQLAKDSGITVEEKKQDVPKFNTMLTQSNMVAEMEKKRQEMLEKMKKARDDAQQEAKKVMDNAMSSVNASTSMLRNMPMNMPSMPSMPNIPPPNANMFNMPVSPVAKEEVKEEVKEEESK